MNQDKAAKQCVGLLAQAIGTNLAWGEDRKSGRARVEAKLRRVNSEMVGMSFSEAWEWSEDDDLVRAALSGLKAKHVKSTYYDRKDGTTTTNYDLELLEGTWRIALRYFSEMAYGEGPMALATGEEIDNALKELKRVFRQPNYISSR
tara:strand:+ start:758 stop:1198 length:441 start_codon:yes stop_codon:yes gene_type:complete